MEKKFLTIRETAKTGILPEFRLRQLHKQGKIPCIMCGSKCMVNYDLLLKSLDVESEKAIKNYETEV